MVVDKLSNDLFEGPIAVLDILGFKQHICSGNNDHVIYMIERLRQRAKYSTDNANQRIYEGNNLHTGDKSVEHVDFVNISDAVLVVNKSSDGTIRDRCSRLTDAISSILANSFISGIPLRGALAFGSYTFDKIKDIYFGKPILEAMEYERLQQWIGVGICPSFEKCLLLGEMPRNIVPFDVPMKGSGRKMTHAINWSLLASLPNRRRADELFDLGSKSPDENIRLKWKNTRDFFDIDPHHDLPIFHSPH